MIKRTIAVLAILLLLPLLMAMGGLQGQNPEKIPVPERKFFVTFVDETDVITECRNASIDGQTYLEGKRGSGSNAIPFVNIQEVTFLMKGETLLGVVMLRDGSTFKLDLNKDQRASGYTKYGTFQIKLGDLKKMTVGK